jgi:hypothetical protein
MDVLGEIMCGPTIPIVQYWNIGKNLKIIQKKSNNKSSIFVAIFQFLMAKILKPQNARHQIIQHDDSRLPLYNDIVVCYVTYY